MELKYLAEKFKIPEAAYASIDKFFTKEEIYFIEKMEKALFTAEDVEKVLGKNADDFIKSSYRRGILSIEDETNGTYRIADFYSRLDIFSISEQEVWRSIPEKQRLAMDEWYFDAYCDGLDADPQVRPTGDEILPLKKVLEFIDGNDRPVYLNYCDCRSLRGECGKPTKVCITYKNGINSFAHRGLSEKIDKQRAKEVVQTAEKKGLMHTVNANGICNCCGDCCYLFRAQERRQSRGFWPKQEQIIDFNNETCSTCGACVKRCHLGVFSKEDGRIIADTSKCVGCGICATVCPTKSLELKGRVVL